MVEPEIEKKILFDHLRRDKDGVTIDDIREFYSIMIMIDNERAT